VLTFEEWEPLVPAEITSDSLWKMKVYRLALFLADLAWEDAAVLHRDPRTRGLPGQLYDAVGSISANVGEGYSRAGSRDRARFYEYGYLLGPEVVGHRIAILTEIIRLLLTMVPNERTRIVREAAAYDAIEI
jgi:hypothetical protein